MNQGCCISFSIKSLELWWKCFASRGKEEPILKSNPFFEFELPLLFYIYRYGKRLFK